MTSPSVSEQVIRRLYQITNDYEKGFDFQVNELLKMGLARFNLDIGILSHIQDSTYTVKNCVTPLGVEMKPGDTFDFDITYCKITCGANKPVALEHIGEDDQYGTHPAYQSFGLESYIGVPIRVDGKLYGTLNFSSALPYPRKFEEIDIDAIQLMASWIQVEIVRHRQEQRLNELNKKLIQQAHMDSLTKIPNRRSLYKSLRKELNRITRNQGMGVLAFIDIDHFKNLNDQHGHLKGDEALKIVAKTIQESIRECDYLARYGGEEFVVWLPDSDEETSGVVFDRIMQNIGEIDLIEDPITVSIGANNFVARDKNYRDINQLIDNIIDIADEALYEAKETGRNRVVNYTHNNKNLDSAD